jgi:hypothetical protein
MSGSHNGQPPAPDARYNRDAMTAAAAAFNRAATAPPAESTCYDLRTVGEREAELAMRMDNLADRDEYRERRIHALEAQVKALETVAAQHADVLQLVRLHLGI